MKTLRRFFEIAIGQVFYWRDGEWIKTTYSHARPVDDPTAKDTFVPNQESVAVSIDQTPSPFPSEDPGADTEE